MVLLLCLHWAWACVARGEEVKASGSGALLRYTGEYAGRWKLQDFSDVPYVELGEYLKERDFGKRDTLRVEVWDDSTLVLRLQRGGVLLRVVHYKALDRGDAREEELYFRVVPNGSALPLRYRSADGRLDLSFRVLGSAGGSSYMGISGYEEGDGRLMLPSGSLDAQCVVEHEGSFDGHTVRMRSVLRFVLERVHGGSIGKARARMDARCRGCI